MPRIQLPDHLRRPVGRPALYAWDTWLNGEPHTIRQGVDFECDRTSMRQQIYSRATRDGKKVSVRQVHHDSLLVHAGRGQAAPAGRIRKYDWDNLLDGDVHQLQIGVDVPTNVKSFRSYVQAVAVARGLRCSLKVVGGFAFLKAMPRIETGSKDDPAAVEPAASVEPQKIDPLETRDPFGALG